jgi:hypothetical protein
MPRRRHSSLHAFQIPEQYDNKDLAMAASQQPLCIGANAQPKSLDTAQDAKHVDADEICDDSRNRKRRVAGVKPADCMVCSPLIDFSATASRHRIGLSISPSALPRTSQHHCQHVFSKR